MTKISALPAASAANDTDQLEVNQGGTSRRVTVGQIGTVIGVSGGDSGAINVRTLGAVGDGLTDDTAAFQAACDAAGALAAPLHGTAGAVARTSWVSVPPGTYRVSHVNVPSFVGIAGGVSAFKGARSTIIKHTDPTQSCFTMVSGRCNVSNLFFDVNNTNMTAPTAGPPTITCNDASDYNEVYDCHFHFSYIAIGSPATATNNAWVVNNCSGFVHHRFVYIKNTLDVSYVSNLHTQNPEGTAWDPAWYSYNNKIVVEIDNCDGLMGENWFSWAGRGLFKHSGTGNLLVTVNNACGENITHGIEIVTGSVNGQHVNFNGGYLQTNARPDGVYLISNEAAVDLRITNMYMAAASADYVRITDAGTTTILGCTMLGAAGAIAFHKMSATSRLIIDDCTLRSFATVFLFDASCDTLVEYGPMNRMRRGTATLYNPTPTGYVDVTEPVIFEDGAGNTQTTSIVRRTPSSDHVLYGLGSFLVHQQVASATGVGGSFEATGSNVGGTSVIGVRARFKCYGTGGTPGGENARAWLQGYSTGAYGPPFVVFEAGGIGYQSAQGAGGTVVQATDKTTTVALNKTTGAITTAATSLAANTAVSFTFTNSTINAIDILHIKHSSGGTFGSYRIEALEATGSAIITITNITAGALAQALVLKFYVFKTTTS